MTQEGSLERARAFIASSIDEYRNNRLKYYTTRKSLLRDLLKKDPMIPALRGALTAHRWLDEAFSAHESSSEETVMGNVWQQILTDLSTHSVGAGDFLFEKEDILWVLEMKTQVNTLNGPGRAQTLKTLKERIREHSSIRTPRLRGVMPMIGVLRGDPKDQIRTHRTRAPENRDIDGFQYRYMVGAPFRSWLTGVANPAELIDMHSGQILETARRDCLARLHQELNALLQERNLPDDIKSVLTLASESRVRRPA